MTCKEINQKNRELYEKINNEIRKQQQEYAQYIKENTIKLSNGRIFNLIEDKLTTQDIRELSGVEVRWIEDKQFLLACRN